MKLYTKQEWGPRPAKPPKWRWRKPNMIVAHHLGVPVDGVPPAEVMRRTQAFHMRDKGWSDIAYHYLIDHNGDAWEGRGVQRMGGATRGYNDVSLAIAFMGDYNQDRLTLLQRDAFHNLYWACKFVHGRIDRVRTHGELASTACPGLNVKTMVSDGRKDGIWK